MSTLLKKYFDVSKFVIWGDTTEDSPNRKAKMVFSFRDGNPRLTVYTGNSGADSVIAWPSDIPTMVSVLNLIKDIINAAPGSRVSIDSLTNQYENNKPTKDKKVVSTLYVGKSKEGLVYLSVIAEGKSKIMFTIKPSEYHAYRDGEKNTIPANKVSELMATGLVDLLLNILSQAILQYSNEEYGTGARKQTAIKAPAGQASNVAVVKEDLSKDLDDIGL